MNSKLMNTYPSMSLEGLQLSLMQRENELIRAQLARRVGRSPHHVLPSVATEGLFDIFKPKIKEAKEKEKSIDQRLAELYQRVKNHRPSDRTFEATGLLALLKNGRNFKQTVADLKAAMEAEVKFQQLQLEEHKQCCALWVKVAKDGDLVHYFRERSKVRASTQPVQPHGFKKKLGTSNHQHFKDRKYVSFHNSLGTVVIDTGFDDLAELRPTFSHEPKDWELEDPSFGSFNFYSNWVEFTPGPLNQFHGQYTSGVDESLHTDILSLIEECETATMNASSYNSLHMETSEFSAASRVLSNETISPALVAKLTDGYTEGFFEYGEDLMHAVWNYDSIDAISMIELMVEHLAIAFLKT